MPITVAGVPASQKTPGAYMSILFGGAGTNAGTAPIKLLIVGNMIATALTGTTPSFTVPAGTWQTGGVATENAVQLGGKDDAATFFGPRSELYRMAKFAQAMDPGGTSFQLWACPIAEAGGNTKASATLTLASGPATAGGTIRIAVADETFDVGVSTGDTATVIATNIATAIMTQHPDLPVTAQFAAGVLTVTFVHGGTRGNNCLFTAAWVNGRAVIPIGSSATAQFGVTAAITGAGKLAGGATADSVTNYLTNTANQSFDHTATATDDSTNINKIVAQLVTLSAPTIMLWGQLTAATVTDPTTAQTQALGINNVFGQLVVAQNNPCLTGDIAAQMAAGRIAGDFAVVTNPLDGEADSPAANLNGLELKSIPVPPTAASVPTPTQVESMLNNGCTPLVPSSAHPGFMAVAASYTTLCKDANGNYNYAAAETKVPTVEIYIARGIRNDIVTTYRGFNLAKDPANGNPINVPKVVTPTIARNLVVRDLRAYEAAGYITGVDALLDEVLTEVDAVNPARMNISIPAFPIPNAAIFAANVHQRSV